MEDLEEKLEKFVFGFYTRAWMEGGWKAIAYQNKLHATLILFFLPCMIAFPLLMWFRVADPSILWTGFVAVVLVYWYLAFQWIPAKVKAYSAKVFLPSGSIDNWTSEALRELPALWMLSNREKELLGQLMEASRRDSKEPITKVFDLLDELKRSENIGSWRFVQDYYVFIRDFLPAKR